MNKIEVISRRILGWKLHSLNKWFNPEKNIFIEDFHPEENLDQAMLIVERLEEFGFIYTNRNDYEVCFNDVCATGDTLAQAITNAAYSLAEVEAIPSEWF